MRIEKALLVGGWMNVEELTWLAQQAETHTKIVEVGSYCGRSTRALADNTTGCVTAVDAWEDFTFGIGNTKGTHEAFVNNTRDLTNIRVLKMTSLGAANFLRGEDFDMVFLDADHRYEGVKADILAWTPLIRPGGLLCGHDYNDKDYGVTEAVNEALSGVQSISSIWWKLV